MTKIALSGKFSNYELICEADGKIMCHNTKDDTTQPLCTFDPMYLTVRYRGDRYKNLRKWIDRKCKILYEEIGSFSKSTMSDTEKDTIIKRFHFMLKSEVREFKLKDLEE